MKLDLSVGGIVRRDILRGSLVILLPGFLSLAAMPGEATTTATQGSAERPINTAPAYLNRLLERNIALLEGRELALVYPKFAAQSPVR
jgi:hypothetical protein